MGDMQLQVDIGLSGHWKRAHLASLGIKKQMNISCKPKGKPSVHDRPSMLSHSHWHYPLSNTHRGRIVQLKCMTENTALSFLLLKGNAGKTSSFHKVHHSWLALVVYLCCHSNYSIVSKKAKTKKINPNKTERCDPGTPEICSYTHYVTWPLQIQRQEIKHCQHWALWRLLHIDKWVKSKKVDGNLPTDLPCI